MYIKPFQFNHLLILIISVLLNILHAQQCNLVYTPKEKLIAPPINTYSVGFTKSKIGATNFQVTLLTRELAIHQYFISNVKQKDLDFLLRKPHFTVTSVIDYMAEEHKLPYTCSISYNRLIFGHSFGIYISTYFKLQESISSSPNIQPKKCINNWIEQKEKYLHIIENFFFY